MELITLRYFAMVARELHFRRAAEKLHMTQAPLSIAIRKLEDELGTELFKRTSRSVELTPAGKLFLSEAEAVLNRVEQSKIRLQDFLYNRRQFISIGYNEPAIHSFLPEALAVLHREQPDLQLQLREIETVAQWELLKTGKLDIGFMRPLHLDMSGLSSMLVLREKYLLAIPTDHPLAALEVISGRDLANQQIILFSREVNPPAYDQLSTLLTAGCQAVPHFRQDSRNKSSMLAMVRAGFGVALLPESCCRELSGNIVVRPLNMNLPPVDIMAVWNPDNVSKPLKEFLNILERISTPEL